MKLYVIFNKRQGIIYKSIDEKEAKEYYKQERLQEEYYKIIEVESDVIENYYKGKSHLTANQFEIILLSLIKRKEK